MIPPARTSKAQDELKKRPKKHKEHLAQRDAIIKDIRRYETFDEGLKQWKIASGYHKLQQKTEKGRLNEVICKANILNLMASLGRAESHLPA